MHSEEQTFISVNSLPSFTKSIRPDLMGNLQNCFVPGDLLLLSYDYGANEFSLINKYQQTELRDVVTTKNGLTLFAGKLYKECGHVTSAAVFSLHRKVGLPFKVQAQNRLQVLYRDTEPFNSSSAAILEGANGFLWLVGTTIRPLDAISDYYTGIEIEDIMKDITHVEHYQRGEGFIQSLTENVEPKERTWLTTGAFVSIGDASLDQDHMLIGGLSDWQVMWALYR